MLVPPATDHSIANEGDSDLCCVSVQSPAVAPSPRVFAADYQQAASEYDDDDELLSRRTQPRRRPRAGSRASSSGTPGGGGPRGSASRVGPEPR